MLRREELLLVLTLPLDSWSLSAAPVTLVGWGEPGSPQQMESHGMGAPTWICRALDP